MYMGPEDREFFELIHSYLNQQDAVQVREAYELARQEHGEQRRKTGELFFSHPVTVAHYLAEYRLDAEALMAALLHDVAEDTLVSIAQIREWFGPEVSKLVDGVTKLKEVTAGVARQKQLSPQRIRDASLHKMFEAMTDDVRVVLVKLFDRLHNMRTIQALPFEKQLLKAEETLSVYAPLANRLGIWCLKTELEALSLHVQDKDAYLLINHTLDHHFHKQQGSYTTIAKEIIAYLQENDVTVINVLPLPESIYSVYQGRTTDSISFDDMTSPMRVVVLLKDVPSCYLALGHLHQKWRPVPGKFDDYIAVPRENLYRALHTTVIYSSGEPLKIRFRSMGLDVVSEIGVLAKWMYAGTPMWTNELAERVNALFASISESISLESQDYSSAVKGVVEDVFGHQVMVYTPRGDIIELPEGATPVDFAYAIHTEVGNHCQTAYVNDKPYPLNKSLKDGDQVRIVKSGRSRPHRTWLDEDLGYLITSRARAQVRRWFRRLTMEQAISEGQRLLKDELVMLGSSDRSHQQIAEHFDFQNPQELYHAFGRAELLPTTVATQILTQDWHQEPCRQIGRVVRTSTGQEYVITNIGNRELRLCRSCNARPGDTIVGFFRSDGGVTIHKEACYTLRPDPMADRSIKLNWGRIGENEVRIVRVQIDVYDRYGLLFEITELLESEHVNIAFINTQSMNGDRQVRVTLDLEIASPRQLVRILHRAHALVNVFAVHCLHSREKSLADLTADRESL